MPRILCNVEGCAKKLTLTSFPCKCKKQFCDKHRYPEEHACTFDFQESGKQILLKTMSSPITSVKVEAI